MIVIMTQDMFICDICRNEICSTRYHMPAEIKEANKLKVCTYEMLFG